MKKGISIIFTIICVFLKAQGQDFCSLNNYSDMPCVSLNVDINVLKKSFNHILDSTDYFSSGSLKAVQLIKHDTLSVTRILGNDTVLNIGEYTMLLDYENDSVAKIAFKNILNNVENLGSINFFLFIKGGIILGIKENQVAIYHPNGNNSAIKKNLIDITNKYHQLGYDNIYYNLTGRLEKFNK